MNPTIYGGCLEYDWSIKSGDDGMGSATKKSVDGGLSVNQMVFFRGLPGVYVGFMGSGDVPQSGKDVWCGQTWWYIATEHVGDWRNWMMTRKIPTRWMMFSERKWPTKPPKWWPLRKPMTISWPEKSGYGKLSRWYQKPWNMTHL